MGQFLNRHMFAQSIPLSLHSAVTHIQIWLVFYKKSPPKSHHLLKLIHFHGIQLTSSEQVLNAHTAINNISTPISRVLLEKLTVARAETCMI
jgi:hypothetical protein